MKYGHIEAGGALDRENTVLVTLDGEDVTKRCRWANDVDGICGLFVLNTAGKFVRDADGAVMETRRGQVVITVEPRVEPLERVAV